MWVMATIAGMWRAVRRDLLPPRVRARPRQPPLFWVMGAVPVRAAISPRLADPVSGSSVRMALAAASPIPGIDSRTSRARRVSDVALNRLVKVAVRDLICAARKLCSAESKLRTNALLLASYARKLVTV